MNTTDYEKLKLTIRSQLVGMALIDTRYLICVRALDYAATIHTGLRKDGKTPEFYHQLSLVGYALTQVRNMKKPWLIIATLILHDTYEDNQHLEEELREQFPKVFEYVVRCSKIRRGEKVDMVLYTTELSECAICSVVKLIDRLHNISTMLGVFSEKKLVEYVDETVTHYLPMLKTAKRKFQKQHELYELLKSNLNLLLSPIQFSIELMKKKEAAIS